MKTNSIILKDLALYKPSLLTPTSPSAAVMVMLLANEENTFEIVLTKRAPTLLTYAGDYSFPGGMRDEGDKDLYATAMREVEEELNIAPHSYQKIGQLDDFQDRFDHLVRPFVTLMEKKHFEKQHKKSDAEITQIYFFPLNHLSQLKDDPALHHLTRRQPSYSYTHEDVFVWGLTAAILVHVFNIISAKNKPFGKTLR